MELEELDELLEDLVDYFGTIDPYKSYSRTDFIDLIEDANEDNVDYYIGLLKDRDFISEFEYKDGGRYVPSGKRYRLGSRAMQMYFDRKEVQTQTYLTASIALFALAQFVLSFPNFVDVKQIPGGLFIAGSVLVYAAASAFFLQGLVMSKNADGNLSEIN